jgi:hypothetical protein
LSPAKTVLYAVLSSTVTEWNDDNTDGGNFYYRIRSIDTSGIESDLEDSPLISSLSGDTLNMISADQSLTVEIPPSVSQVLIAQNNDYHKDLRLEFEHNASAEGEVVLSSYRLKVLTADGDPVEHVSFKEPLTLRFHYGSGTPIGTKLAAISLAPSAPANLNIFWHNGIEYLRLGGISDNREKEVIVRVVKPGEYQLRRVSRAVSFSLASINPPKVFTPGDPLNYTTINFVVDNPDCDKVTGKIFDLRSEFIADMKAKGDATAASVTLEWDGKTADGQPASKGVYIYQIEGSGRTINGTILLAR